MTAPERERERERERRVLLLQLGDQLLLGVQLVPEAADLFLVDLSVGLDLLLHSILMEHKQRAVVTASAGLSTQATRSLVSQYLHLIGRLDLVLHGYDFLCTGRKR